MSLLIGDLDYIDKTVYTALKGILSNGQYRRVILMVDIIDEVEGFVREIIRKINSVITTVYDEGMSKLINIYAPLLPFKTGALRASFMKAFSIVGVPEGEHVRISLSFHLEQWLGEIPYARFHIQELGQEEKRGKTLLDMDFFINVMAALQNKIIQEIAKAGFLVDWNALIDFTLPLYDKLSDILSGDE